MGGWMGGMHLGEHHLHGGVWRVMDTPPDGEVRTAGHLPPWHDDDETEWRARLGRVRVLVEGGVGGEGEVGGGLGGGGRGRLGAGWG